MSRARSTIGRAAPRRSTILFLFSAFVLIVTGIGFDQTRATFNGAAANDLNSVSAARDLVAPTTTRTVIAKRHANAEPLGTTGQVGRNTSYNVYAQIADTGNPASGVGTVTANVNNLTAGQTAVTLTKLGSAVTVNGLTYEWKSAALTTDPAMAAGTPKTYSLATTDVDGNASSSTGHPVAVENPIVAPTATGIATTNAGGQTGVASQGDTITYTFSEAVELQSITPGWTGAALPVIFNFTNTGTANDSYFISRTASTFNSGTVTMTRNDYVTATAQFNASVAMNAARTIMTVTLGTQINGTVTRGANAGMSWTPTAGVVDLFGNPMSTTPRTEAGANDRDF